MQCPRCNTEIPLNLNICPHCQYNLNNNITMSQTGQPKINDADKGSLIEGNLNYDSSFENGQKTPSNNTFTTFNNNQDNNRPLFLNTGLDSNTTENISANEQYISNDNSLNNPSNHLIENTNFSNLNNETNNTNINISNSNNETNNTNINISSSNNEINNTNISQPLLNNDSPTFNAPINNALNSTFNNPNPSTPSPSYNPNPSTPSPSSNPNPSTPSPSYNQNNTSTVPNKLPNKSDKSDKDKGSFINIVSVNHPHKFQNNLFNVLAYLVVITLWIVVIYFTVNANRNDYFFKEDPKSQVSQNNNTIVDDEMLKYNGVSKSGQKDLTYSTGVTSIIYDNQYNKQFTLTGINDVERLISTDSVKQKTNCSQNIINIENEIIENYGIIAVNFCEMDETFAKELRDVVKYIYNQYPQARAYLTNLTLANVEDGQSYMAAFMPVFTFATSNTSSSYPVAIKTQIILNAKYFLDTSKINNSVEYGVKTKYFPNKASRSSTVAHEFGHYLSYIALLNTYKAEKMIFVKSTDSDLLFSIYDDFNEGNFSYNLLTQAYEEYKKEMPDKSFEEFRNSISEYAVAKDSYGKYIYDETIAEAFHDVYLNNTDAALASRIIVKVLESKL